MSTLLIGAGLLAIVSLITASIVKDKKAGKAVCGCSGCSGCSSNGCGCGGSCESFSLDGINRK